MCIPVERDDECASDSALEITYEYTYNLTVKGAKRCSENTKKVRRRIFIYKYNKITLY